MLNPIIDERKTQTSELAPHGVIATCNLCAQHLERNPQLAGDGSTEHVARLLTMRLVTPPDHWQHQTYSGDLLHKAMENQVGERHAMADMRGAARLKYGADVAQAQDKVDWDKFLLDARGMGLDFDQAREMWNKLEGK